MSEHTVMCSLCGVSFPFNGGHRCVGLAPPPGDGPTIDDVAAQVHAVLTGIDRWDLQSDKTKAKYRMAAEIVLRAAARHPRKDAA